MDSQPSSESQSLLSDSQAFEKDYYKCLLFNWSTGNETPFQAFPKEKFGPGEVREEWYKYQLRAESRMKILKALKTFPQEVMSMFGKIERGNYCVLSTLMNSMYKYAKHV